MSNIVHALKNLSIMGAFLMLATSPRGPVLAKRAGAHEWDTAQDFLKRQQPLRVVMIERQLYPPETDDMHAVCDAGEVRPLGYPAPSIVCILTVRRDFHSSVTISSSDTLAAPFCGHE